MTATRWTRLRILLGIESDVHARLYFAFLATLLAAAAAIGLLSYNFVSIRYRDRLEDLNHSVLENIRADVDSSILERGRAIGVDVALGRGADDPIQSLLGQEGVAGTSDIVAVHRQLSELVAANGVVHSIAVYFNELSLIISDTAVTFLDSPSDRMTPRDVSWIEVFSRMRGPSQWMPHAPYIDYRTNSLNRNTTVAYLHSLPVMSHDEYRRGLLIVRFNQYAIRDRLAGASPIPEGSAALVENDGSVISAVGRDQGDSLSALFFRTPNAAAPVSAIRTEDNRELFVSRVASQVTDWAYMTVVPFELINQQVTDLGVLIALICLTAVVIAMVISHRVTGRLIGPLERLISSVNDFYGSVDLGWQLDAGSEQELVLQASRYFERTGGDSRRILSENAEVIRDDVIRNLLDGVYRSEQEVTRRLQVVGSGFPHPRFRVFVVSRAGGLSLDTPDYPGVLHYGFRDVVERLGGATLRLFTASHRGRVVIIENSLEPQNGIDRLIWTVTSGVAMSARIDDAIISVGDVRHRCLDIAASYAEACEAISDAFLYFPLHTVYDARAHRRRRSHSVDATSCVPAAAVQLFRNEDGALFADTLLSCVGDLRELDASGRLAEEVFDAILLEVAHELATRHLDINTVTGCDALRHASGLRTVEARIEFYLEAHEKAQQLIARDHDEAFVAIATRFIDSNLSDELSLQTLADRLGMSYGYASEMFKKLMACGFIEYVTRLRMERARGLLEEGHVGVAETARAVGYSSTSYFIRKFREYTGSSPAEYRKQTHWLER